MTLDHPIFTRWPAQYPDRLQLFSAPTPPRHDQGLHRERREGRAVRTLCCQDLANCWINRRSFTKLV